MKTTPFVEEMKRVMEQVRENAYESGYIDALDSVFGVDGENCTALQFVMAKIDEISINEAELNCRDQRQQMYDLRDSLIQALSMVHEDIKEYYE